MIRSRPTWAGSLAPASWGFCHVHSYPHIAANQGQMHMPYCRYWKVATTDVLECRINWQGSVPGQAPVQPLNVFPASGIGVKVS